MQRLASFLSQSLAHSLIQDLSCFLQLGESPDRLICYGQAVFDGFVQPILEPGMVIGVGPTRLRCELVETSLVLRYRIFALFYMFKRISCCFG